MKRRIAKKIIKTSETYWYYCTYCDTRKKWKYYPYWADKWDYYNFANKYLVSLLDWKVDERLYIALHLLPQYIKEIKNAINTEQNYEHIEINEE